ncbi:phosphatase PAP2 family protein [Sulfurovum sp. NBC37-1]|uniref:phosphatase PAP2 family protein n=1 Tax=Sulfurovum sp. (strain NBC37-1) TaxID=387093 RepID=UPI001305146B|nr:phosphatase PAP2 family protein [Sulfurovum sp. NBC37-1]
MKSIREKIIFVTLATAALYVILFLFFDRNIDLWMYHNMPGTAAESIGKQISVLASSLYVNIALLCAFGYIVIFDPGIRKKSTKKLFYIIITVTVAVMIGEGFKYLLGRYRPIMFFEHGEYGLHFFTTKWVLNSTPSDHTIRAFSFFTALGFLYKRTMLLFMFLALMVGASRVVVTAHYPSDVLFGAFVGIMTAVWMHGYFFDEIKGD